MYHHKVHVNIKSINCDEENMGTIKHKAKILFKGIRVLLPAVYVGLYVSPVSEVINFFRAKLN